MARLRAAPGIDVSLRNLFESPTVAGMTEAIDALSWSAQSRAPTDGTGNREEIDHFAEQGMVAAHGGIFRTGRLHPTGKKQGYGLTAVPCGPDQQRNRRMTTLCLAG
jgi:hypothetical protein